CAIGGSSYDYFDYW
nr:immunoglobulin heavy chain junction region [Mus musculus]